VEYQPAACKQKYRLVIVRKNLVIQRDEKELLNHVRDLVFFHLSPINPRR
jgi:hypothetical protein